MNLLKNAIDAIPISSKGHISITTKVQKKSFIISINDNGTGIPATELKKIFDPFYTTKEVGRGLGLGLSISYSIVEEHSGSIKVESVLQKGSTFTVILPINQPKKSLSAS